VAVAESSTHDDGGRRGRDSRPSSWKEAKVAHQLRQDERALPTGTGAADNGKVESAGTALLACVYCGGAIADVLARLGSTRCHDCRRVEAAPSALLGPAR
jgi:hypothetical protein